jgi:NAD(P)-dependent dehydrogenase (short-subunit alcohol dehydrogenase family)
LDGQFKGKVVLVTGGGSGIGRATILLFAKKGAKCVIANISDEGGKETVRMIKEAGGEAIFVKADVTKAADVEALINKAVETYGRLDCAHNNAGGGNILSPIADMTEELWDYYINLNLKNPWLCMKYEIPQMIKQGGGVIVNTASGAATHATPAFGAYCAAKAGLVQLTRVAALEYGKAGIRINTVSPGFTNTPATERLIAGFPKAIREMMNQRILSTPIGRLGRQEELAEAVVWLCSDAASFVTGSNMVVDGGFGLM